MQNHNRPLGRRQSKDFDHVDKYPFSAVAPFTVPKVELILDLPKWHNEWDQGSEGACFLPGTYIRMLNGGLKR